MTIRPDESITSLFNHLEVGRESRRLQRALDLVAAVAMGLVALPLAAAAGLLVRLTSRGPAIYSQVRLGRGGRPFRIYKLRTMYHQCEAVSGIRWATAGDPRVTPLGRVLRRLHIDELPQLFNVIRGEMSLVGPRPERPEIAAELARNVPNYLQRLRVRPGLTGLAQIQHPADTDVNGVAKKLVYDLCYIEKRGVRLDVQVLFGTVLYLAGFGYDRVRKFAFLPAAPSTGVVRAADPELDLGSQPIATPCLES